MKSRIATIARFTALEAVRTRLPVLTAIVIIVLLVASTFVREIAIAESTRVQTAFYAASVRFAAVFICALHVIGSISREFQDKGADVALALDLPRSNYILGKLAGFLAIAVGAALAAAVPLALLSGIVPALQWSISLAVELAVVVALSLFCAVTFASVMPAASFVLAFYLLARSMTAIRLISAHPTVGSDTLSQRVMNWFVEGLALVVPAVDNWTATAWLVNEPTRWSALLEIAGRGSLFVIVLAAAAIFDLQRRNF
jgi:ABC-type transport system involved in multi-copper enzyme maturation permease subunit